MVFENSLLSIFCLDPFVHLASVSSLHLPLVSVFSLIIDAKVSMLFSLICHFLGFQVSVSSD